jgi:hypothetical protein
MFPEIKENVRVLTWNDKTVTMISTYHTDNMHVSISRGKEIIKLLCLTVIPTWERSTYKIKCCSHTYRNKRKVQVVCKIIQETTQCYHS